MQKHPSKRRLRPPQHQERQPGLQSIMRPRPKSEDRAYHGSGKLQDKVALITGGDSGIGRAIAIYFAKEGADITVVYLDEHDDAKETKRQVEQEGRRCLLVAGDIGDEGFCAQAIQQTIDAYGQLDCLVNNAAEQHSHKDITQLTSDQLERTFRTNIFSMFHLVKLALPYLKSGATVINTTSVTAYRGSAHLLDYAATKGAIVAFTRSLSQALIEKGIRVNAVAPGPVWTPLIPSSYPTDAVATFGSDAPMHRAGEPDEIAPCYVFLASNDSAYMSGQVLHPNGGEIVNG